MKIRPDHKHIPFGPYLSKMFVDDDFCKRLLKVGKTLANTSQCFSPMEFNLKKDPWIEEEFKVGVFQPTYKLKSLWINFQKAGEYIPIHTHHNCDISFILFLEVPKEMLAEKRVTKGLPPGFTGFLYGEDVHSHRKSEQGKIEFDLIIKPEENVLYMFPSNLRHCVARFNSKVTRMSVTGNIIFDQIQG